MNFNISVVIVAGGMGTRLGADVPKAFVGLGGKHLFEYSLEIFLAHKAVSEVVIVVPDSVVEKAEEIVGEMELEKIVVIVNGGDQRWNSVYNGIMSTVDSSEWVLVHDAARPFVTKDVIDSLLKKCGAHKCCITATPVTDTIRTFKEGICTGTVDRSTLIRVGTPQLFHRETLLKAFLHAGGMEPSPTDEAMLMEKSGVAIGIAWGDPKNFKITTPEDLEIAQALINKGQ